MVVSKESLVFARDEKGELVPIEVEFVIDENDDEQLPYKGQTIFIAPIPRGKVRKLFGVAGLKSIKEKGREEDSDLDKKLIIEHCVEPSFTDKDVEGMKLAYSSMIVDTILKLSGLSIKKSKKKAMEEKETEFSKNSEELGQEEKTKT
jgi:hypothetical protein